MDIFMCVFYAGGFWHLWDRGRSFWQCVFWPADAAKVLCRMLDRAENKRLGITDKGEG